MYKLRTRVFGRPVGEVLAAEVLARDGRVVALLELALVLAPVGDGGCLMGVVCC